MTEFIINFVASSTLAYNAFTEAPFAKYIGAFGVGFMGSFAYVTALYYRFIGDDRDHRMVILEPFLRRETYSHRLNVYYRLELSFWRTVWYCAIGGFISFFFQLTVPNFAVIQSLIIGATWPSSVLPYLSGRMMAPTQQEKDQLLEDLKPSQSVFESVSGKMDNLAEQIKDLKKKLAKKSQ